MIANEVIQFSERLQQETESIINKINGGEEEKTSDIFEDKIVFFSEKSIKREKRRLFVPDNGRL